MADILARTRLLTGTTAEWAANDLTLGNGELVVEHSPTLIKLKVGDGTKAYSALPFVSANPIVPLEYLTETEGDARYLQLVDAESVIVSSGAPDSGKLVRLAADGKIDSSMVTIVTGGYLGTADFTAAKPAGSFLAGDFYINTTSGPVHASWGLAGGTTSVVGEEMIFDGVVWALLSSAGAYLPITGGTLTGPLRVSPNASPFTGAVPSGAVVHAVGANATPARFVADAVGGLSIFHGRRSEGTLAAPTAVLSDASLAAFAGGGYNGAAWTTNLDGGMFVRAAEPWTATANGTYLMFTTQALGTAGAAIERMRIDPNGSVGIGGPPNFFSPTYKVLTVTGGAGGAMVQAAAGTVIGELYGSNAESLVAIGSRSNHPVTINVASVPQMHFGTAGNIGISAPPTAGVKVYIRGTSNVTSYGSNGDVRVASLNETVTTSYGWNQFHCSDHFTMGSAAVATARLEGPIFNLMAGSGYLRVGGHITRFEAVVAMPTVAGVGSLTTIAHGGTRIPDLFSFTYRCAVAEHGYTVGQEVFLQTVAGNMTVMFKADSTNCYFMAPIAMGVVYRGDGSNTLITLTPASWRLVCRAHWL